MLAPPAHQHQALATLLDPIRILDCTNLARNELTIAAIRPKLLMRALVAKAKVFRGCRNIHVRCASIEYNLLLDISTDVLYARRLREPVCFRTTVQRHT